MCCIYLHNLFQLQKKKMKYSKEMIKACADWVRKNGLIDYGGARLADFIAFFGIDQRTYYRWLNNAEFADAIKSAKEDFRSSLETDLVKSLAMAAKGYEWEQITTEYMDVDGRPKIKKQIKRTMRESSNVGAAIFLLTNIAPKRWKNKQLKEVSGVDGEPIAGCITSLPDHRVIFENYERDGNEADD